MRWDSVHHSQSVYRTLVTAFSYPGRPVDIGNQAKDIEISGILPPSLYALGLTLLDSDTSFCCLGPNGPAAQLELEQLCACPSVELEHAAFVFVLDPRLSGNAFETARKGTGEDPHLGATIVLLSQFGSSIQNGSGGEHRVSARGPGIAQCITFDAGEHALLWMAARSQANEQFPLGIDLIICDSEGRLIALPRTTQLESEAQSQSNSVHAKRSIG